MLVHQNISVAEFWLRKGLAKHLNYFSGQLCTENKLRCFLLPRIARALGLVSYETYCDSTKELFMNKGAVDLDIWFKSVVMVEV